MTGDPTHGPPIEVAGRRHETVLPDFTATPTPPGDLPSRAELAGLEIKWFEASPRAHLFNLSLTTAHMLRLLTPGCDRLQGDSSDR